MIPTEEYPESIKTKMGVKYVVIARVSKERELGEEILTVTFFSSKDKKLKFRVFANRRDFITDKVEENKWSTSTLDNLLDWGWQRQPTTIMMADEKSRICGVDFFKNGETDTISALDEFQKNTRKDKLEKSHNAIKMQTDAIMAQIKEIPKDIDKWINEVPLLSSRYIYYKRDKKIINGYCTSCKSDVQVIGAYHNADGQCPKCKSKIIFKAIGKSKNIQDESSMAIIEKGDGKLDGAIIVRCFILYKDYRGNYRKPVIRYYEEARYVIKNKTVFMFEWKSVYRAGGYKPVSWHRLKGSRIIRNYFLYTNGLELLLSDSPWKYSAIKEYATHAGRFNVLAYLDTYLEYPAIEYLTKLSLFNIVNESLTIYGVGSHGVKLKGKSIKEILGVEKCDITFLQKVNIKGSELKEYREAKKKGQRFTEDILNWVRRHGTNYGRFQDVSNYTTMERAMNYLEKQVNTKRHMSDIILDWVDYLRAAKELKYDIESDYVLFPKDLKISHDRVMDIAKKKKNEHHNAAIQNFEEKLNDLYRYETKKYVIRAPKNIDEIINEGSRLKHCVATYISRIANRETSILFVREKDAPDEPFYTMEIKKKEVVQIRGQGNCSMTPDVNKFIEDWKSKMLKNNSNTKITIPA